MRIVEQTIPYRSISKVHSSDFSISANPAKSKNGRNRLIIARTTIMYNVIR